MKRPYGTGQLYEKSGSYYGRWRTPDGRRLNRRIGPIRAAGDIDGITRARPSACPQDPGGRGDEIAREGEAEAAVTVDLATDELRDRLAIEGARQVLGRLDV